MNARKFQIGDKIKIATDKYHDYGLLLGKTGEITELGMNRRGIFTYLVKMDETVSEIRVWEPDMEKV